MLFVQARDVYKRQGVSFGVVIFKSRIVFLFFLCAIPVSVLIIVGFKGKIKNHNRAFRKEMEETSAKVMEMVEMIPAVSYTHLDVYKRQTIYRPSGTVWNGRVLAGYFRHKRDFRFA